VTKPGPKHDDSTVLARGEAATTRARPRARQPSEGSAVDTQRDDPTQQSAMYQIALKTMSMPSLSTTSQSSGMAIEVQRYEYQGTIGAGGMGEVLEMRDRDLLRNVALKRLRTDRTTPEMLALFLQEAQLTAQLEHPNIVPVHELGTTHAAVPFFTMKRVTGTTLQDVFRKLSSNDKATLLRFTRTRMLITFLEITRGVAYAHARGVMHRDLKAQNILIGDNGETLVADWGLACPDTMPFDDDEQTPLPPVSWPALRPGDLGISGSLRAMSPEQAQGMAIDRRTDVYALGIILYEMLTGVAPFGWKKLSQAAAPRTMPTPPRQCAPERNITEELEQICMRCLAVHPTDRYRSAGQLSRAVEAALTGDRRRQRAVDLITEGQQLRARRVRLLAEQAALVAEVAALEQRVMPWDDEKTKQPLWLAEEKRAALEVALDECLANTIDRFTQALSHDDGNATAEDALADLHMEQFLAAEVRGDRREQHFHRRQVERYHRGKYQPQLSGIGTLQLRVHAQGIAHHLVRVQVQQLVERGKRIVAEDAVALAAGQQEIELPMGSYLFLVEPPADTRCAATRVHVHIGRQEQVRLDVALPLVSDLRAGTHGAAHGFVHVPAGPFLRGGDEHAQNAGPRTEVVLPGFLMARAPVTCAEYLLFLNSVAKDSLERALRHAPRTKPEGGVLWPHSEGRFVLPTHDADGNPVLADGPVMGVSYFDAMAYAAWLSAADGIAYRLPTEDEWEKAARGVDGRIYPWGNGFDATFCKMATSRPGRPQPEPVMSFPTDVSVYGMHDAAGGIREWTSSFYDAAQETRTLRGGAWYFNPSFCRVAFRHGYLPHIVFTNFGIRLAKNEGSADTAPNPRG
jgi:eukaryotic-like serine/threonine-protein kinase